MVFSLILFFLTVIRICNYILIFGFFVEHLCVCCIENSMREDISMVHCWISIREPSI